MCGHWWRAGCWLANRVHIGWSQALPTFRCRPQFRRCWRPALTRLPPEEKRLLQTAAVIGTEVPLCPAAGHCGAVRRGAAPRPGAPSGGRVPIRDRLFPAPEYTFKHALTHEVAYGGLLLERRRVLHAHIVEASPRGARRGPGSRAGRTPGPPCLRGEVWDKAVAYCQQAGARAHDRAAFREAVASFEQAIQALRSPARAR